MDETGNVVEKVAPARGPSVERSEKGTALAMIEAERQGRIAKSERLKLLRVARDEDVAAAAAKATPAKAKAKAATPKARRAPAKARATKAAAAG